jgi:hypothetical protein
MPPGSRLQTDSDKRRAWACVVALAIAGSVSSFTGLFAQGLPQTLRPSAVEQLRLLAEWKAGRTVAEKKVDSQLLFALDRAGGRIAPALSRVEVEAALSRRTVEVDIDLMAAADALAVAATVRAGGGTVGFVSPRFRAIRATLAAAAIRPLAEEPAVRRIVPARPAFTQTFVSEGDRAHAADRARNLFGFTGAGIKVCVISNGVDTLAASQQSGELAAVDVLPGQAGQGDEGTAMLEIVHDVAPEAALGYATALGGPAQFAQNILDLETRGCRIIVDDVLYIDESPFQDGVPSAAVDEVAAQGVLYFSSAGNVGNLDDGTSGNWKGDFVAGPPLPLLPDLLLHDFGGGEVANLVTRDAPAVTLHWTDRLGTAANDYDLYVVAGDLSEVVRFSNDTQDGIGGDDDPIEIVSFFGSGAAFGERVIVARAAGEGRLLNVSAFRGRFQRATGAALRGHAAAAGALAIAAAPAAEPFATGQPAGPFPLEFDSSQASELFSADGPRQIFFSASGALLPGAPPDDYSSSGGVVRDKPEITAADGVVTSVGGFERFFGTSAAAPHAAALAAVYWSALPSSSAGDVRAALLDRALDIELPGPDAVTGHGLVDLPAMLLAADVPLRANLALGEVAPVELAGNGDAVLDPGERWRLDVGLVNVGGAGASQLSATLVSASPWVAVQVPDAVWADLPAGTEGTSLAGFEIAIAPGTDCGQRLPFELTAVYEGGVAPETLPFLLTVGAPGPTLRFAYAGPPVFIEDSPLRGQPGAPALASVAIGALGGRVIDLNLTLDGEVCTAELAATTVGIDHSFASNLQIELVAPSGVTTAPVRFAGGFGNNFCQTVLDDESLGPSIQSLRTDDNPFIGNFQPAKPLAIFDGEDPVGTWTLRVTDWNPIDVGNVRGYSLFVTPAVCSAFRGTVEVPAISPAGGIVLGLLLATAALVFLARRRALSGASRPSDG